MSDSLFSLLVSYVFGIFYTIVSTMSSPITGIIADSASDPGQGYDEYYEYPDSEYDFDSDGGEDWRHGFEDPKYKLPCLAASLDASTVNPQVGSPLFNGRIPPEIRTMIFQFALAEDDDKEKPCDAESHYARPGHMYHKVIHTDLLKTCKAVYLECYKFPVQQAEFRFWMDRPPPGWHDTTHKLNEELAAEVKTLHLYVQQYNLDNAFHGVLNNPKFSNVEQVIVTFRRGDWWFWETEDAMTIHPSSSQTSTAEMKKAWEVDHAYHGMQSKKEALLIYVPPDRRWNEFESKFDDEDDRGWLGNGWGWQFWGHPKLKRVDIEFETAAYNKTQLDEIVNHALKWRLPYSEDKALVAGAKVTKTEMWKGPQALRSNYGHPNQMPKGVDRDDMLIQTVTWTPVSVEELKRRIAIGTK